MTPSTARKADPSESGPTFRVEPHPAPTSRANRTAQLADLSFGKRFSDHMATIRYSGELGWHDARITARSTIELDPAAAVFHYAQEVFEGLKAYRIADGEVALFRPDANARRFADSAERLAMPPVPDDLFLEAIDRLVLTDREWIPEAEGASLYLRPFMIATEPFLGVRPAEQYLFCVIASPVGSYFSGDPTALTVWLSENYTRAAPGGTGAAKCGGNYAASLAAQAEAYAQGCDQVVFLDAVERRWVEELGGMNIAFVFDDGSISTPPLNGSILPGITRDSLIRLARDAGMTVREGPYSIEQWRADAASGRLAECFACGTAAVLTPIGRVRTRDGDIVIPTPGGDASVSERLRLSLTAIQRGEAADPYGWVRRPKG